MSAAIPQNANVYTELSSLKALKGQLKSGDKAAVEKVAQQFEAIFLQMMLSGMRKTIQMDDEYGNDKAMYYDLFDKQVAVNLSQKGGIGLAQLMMSQPGFVKEASAQTDAGAGQHKLNIQPGSVLLQQQFLHNSVEARTADGAPVNVKAENILSGSGKDTAGPVNDVAGMEKTGEFNSPLDFVRTVWNVASDVITSNGFDPRVVIAQAALETGWGKHVIRTANGNSSFNLFGIKSGRQWQGDEVVANTLEYKDGSMYQAREGFRAYGSIRESVSDYIDFLKSNQRYQRVLNQLQDPQAYMHELQKAGYATDPQYASKVLKIMGRKEFTELFDNMMQET